MTTTSLLHTLYRKAHGKLYLVILLLLPGFWAHSQDSAAKTVAQPQLTKALDTVVYSHTQRLEEANRIFSKWQTQLVNLPDTLFIKKELDRIDTNTNSLLVKLSIPQYQNNLRFLRGSLILTTEAMQNLSVQEKHIKKVIRELINYDIEVKGTRFEESYLKIAASSKVDTTLARQQETMINMLSTMRNYTNSTIASLNPYQLRLTKAFIKTEFAHTMVQAQLREFNKNLFAHPVPLITTPRSDSMYMDVKEEAKFSLNFIATLVQGFLHNKTRTVLINFALFILILIVTMNNHRILTGEHTSKALALQMAPLIATKPIGTSLAITFFISSFLYRNVPAVITEIIIIGQLISITMLLYKRVSKPLFWRWIALCLLFLRFGFMNLLVGISWEARWGLVFLNIGSIYIILSSYKILKKEGLSKNWILTILIVLTSLQQLVSIIMNVMGFPDAALMQSVNSIFNLTLALTITLSIQIIGEFMNTVDIRLANHQLIQEEEVGQLRQQSHTYFVLLGIAIWVLAFLNTLNIDKILYTELETFLTAQQKFGSATFTYGNILTFALVFLASIWLSQLSSLIIDLLSSRHLTQSGDAKLKNGKLFLRLFILCTGLVVAFIASGIPAQQLTIILGALSVGIGLGLQQLVSNLVSGIIIAIEKPIKVGDVITIGSTTGIVQEVGLRSTVMAGKNGLKIYIPNGEFLSMPLVNQSTLKGRRSIVISLLLAETTDLSLMRNLVTEALNEIPDIMKTPESEIMVNASTDKGILVNVYCWVARHASESIIKNVVLDTVLTKFQAAGIEFGSRSIDYGENGAAARP